MTMYASGYASTTSNRTQSVPTGGGASTTLAVTERAALRTSSTHQIVASRAIVNTATWTLQRNNVTIGTITIVSGQTTGTTTLSVEQRLEPGDELKAIAPSGDPFFNPSNPSLPAATATLTWRFSLASWIPIPEEPNKLFVNNGNTWTSAKEAWVAEETTPNNYQWVRAWLVPPPPPGGSDLITVIQNEFSGGDMEANWTNVAGTSGMSWDVEWFINGVSYTIRSGNVSGGTDSSFLGEENFENGDLVKARMRYVSGTQVGTYGDFSNEESYFKSGL